MRAFLLFFACLPVLAQAGLRPAKAPRPDFKYTCSEKDFQGCRQVAAPEKYKEIIKLMRLEETHYGAFRLYTDQMSSACFDFHQNPELAGATIAEYRQSSIDAQKSYVEYDRNRLKLNEKLKELKPKILKAKSRECMQSYYDFGYCRSESHSAMKVNMSQLASCPTIKPTVSDITPTTLYPMDGSGARTKAESRPKARGSAPLPTQPAP